MNLPWDLICAVLALMLFAAVLTVVHASLKPVFDDFPWRRQAKLCLFQAKRRFFPAKLRWERTKNLLEAYKNLLVASKNLMMASLTVYFTTFGVRCFSYVGYNFFGGGILR